MITNSIPAWLIHKQWSGDTSAKVYFFTENLGLIRCLYRGGRTPKKQALLQPFTSLWVTLNERNNNYYVHSVEWETNTLPLMGTHLFSALYLNELIYYLVQSGAPELEVFQSYVYTLHHLALAPDQLAIEALLRRFEWVLLRACGQNFSLHQEGDTGQSIKAGSYYQWTAGKGLLLAAQGIPGEHLLALAADDLSQPHYLKSAKMLMRQAIGSLLGGREIKARSLYV